MGAVHPVYRLAKLETAEGARPHQNTEVTASYGQFAIQLRHSTHLSESKPISRVAGLTMYSASTGQWGRQFPQWVQTSLSQRSPFSASLTVTPLSRIKSSPCEIISS